MPGLTPKEGEEATKWQSAALVASLSIIALGTGGIKPNVSAFGADQFNEADPRDRREKESFFNWFYLAINVGSLIACTVVVYIQDQLSWTLGFGIPGTWCCGFAFNIQLFKGAFFGSVACSYAFGALPCLLWYPLRTCSPACSCCHAACHHMLLGWSWCVPPRGAHGVPHGEGGEGSGGSTRGQVKVMAQAAALEEMDGQLQAGSAAAQPCSSCV